MPKIYRYQKVTDQYTTHCLVAPDYIDDTGRITEHCTVDGWTYVTVPDGVVLPEQPEIISATLVEVDLAEEPETKAAINAASPHIALINDRVVAKIRLVYSINDEIKQLRVGGADFEAYNTYVEECRAWGKAEKAKLGM